MADINLRTSGEGSTAQRPLSILFGVNASREHVSTYSRAVLESIMKAAGVHTVTITSSYRNAHDQARVMVGNIESKGVKHQKKLYRKKPGSRVIDLYVREKTAIEEANHRGYDTGLQTAYAKQRHLIHVLEDEIVSIGPDKVSKHSSLQAILNVFDVAPRALVPHSKAIEELFIEAALKDPRVTRLLYPPDDPAFHFEVAQLGDFPLSPASSVIA